jgi:hypothetical protein
MRLIKKSEQLLLKKIKTIEEGEEENFQADTINTTEPTVEQEEELGVENPRTHYIPFIDNPVVQSVGNSGWQISEIWKEIRLDDF